MQHRNPDILQALTAYDIADNQQIIDALFSRDNLPLDFLGVTEVRVNELKASLCQFVQDNGITLHRNLLETEEKRLRGIILEALRKKEFDLKSALIKWMQTLAHAVSGRGAHIDLYRGRSSGMAADLMNNRSVRLKTLGADLDVKHCLGADLIHPRDISAAGRYILPPVSLTQNVSADPAIALRNVLTDAFDAMERHQIDGMFVCVPVNCGDSHWCLAKFEMALQSGIQNAVLWDSLGGNISIKKNSPAFTNFTKVVSVFNDDVEPTLQLADVQRNGYSCMDYTLQEAYKEMGVESDLVAANHVNDLRLAILKQIAVNHPQIDDIAANLQIEGDRIIVGNGIQQSPFMPLTGNAENACEDFLNQFATPEKSRGLTLEDKNWQITFDNIFAEYLQALYDKNPMQHINENELVTEARRRAMREVGLFPAVRQSTSSLPCVPNPNPRFRT